MAANDPESTPIGEDPKLESLESRIASARHVEDERLAKDHAPMRDGRGAGMRIASTMVGYPLGGIIIGFGLDKLLDTTPWLTIALMFLAFVGGCIQVIRDSGNSAA